MTNHISFSSFAWTLRSACIFKRFALGSLGSHQVERYVKLLETFPALKAPGLKKEFFIMALESIGEAWRRFIYATQSFPFVLFTLCNVDLPDFIRQYAELAARARACPKCLDQEFSMVILTYIDNVEEALVSKPIADKCYAVQSFLEDVAAYAPISSDLVEALHGTAQTKLNRFRGAKPSDSSAQEQMVWQQINSAYKQFDAWVRERFFDPQALSRLCRYGRKGMNQYSSTRESVVAEGEHSKFISRGLHELEKQYCAGKDGPKFRKLCGFLHSLRHNLESILLGSGGARF